MYILYKYNINTQNSIVVTEALPPPGPSKSPVTHTVVPSAEGVLKVSFSTTEVGSYVVEVSMAGQKVG